MKLRNRKRAYVLLSILSVLIISLSIAYTALSSTLKINFGKVTQTAQTWNVGFVAQTNVSAVLVYGTSSTGRECGTISANATTITMSDTKLSKPGDVCVWKLEVKNSGSINATLSSITPTKPGSTTCNTASGGNMVCGNITYKVATKTDGTVYTAGATLNAGATQQLYVIASYTGGGLNSQAVAQSGASFSLVYGQK